MSINIQAGQELLNKFDHFSLLILKLFWANSMLTIVNITSVYYHTGLQVWPCLSTNLFIHSFVASTTITRQLYT